MRGGVFFHFHYIRVHFENWVGVLVVLWLNRWTVESSSRSSRTIKFTFRQIHLGKLCTPLSSQLWVKQYQEWLWHLVTQEDLYAIKQTNHIYQPLHSGRIWHKVNLFKRSLTGLNSEFSFSFTSCLTKAEEPSLPYYLLIVGGRIIGFIPFPRVLALCEMQSVSSRIWTRVAVSIPYDDNHYTTILLNKQRNCLKIIRITLEYFKLNNCM